MNSFPHLFEVVLQKSQGNLAPPAMTECEVSRVVSDFRPKTKFGFYAMAASNINEPAW
jgi:hypothetical protein